MPPRTCRRPPRPARPEERAMKSNPLLKWLLIPMALLLVFVGVKLFSGAPGGQPAPKGAASTLTPEEMKALGRSEEHTSELQSLMRISYAVFCLNKKKQKQRI